MKKIFCLGSFSMLLLGLVACETCHDCSRKHWKKDCLKNYSETDYELKACQDRNAAEEEKPGTVGLIKGATDLPTSEQSYKDQGAK